MKLTNARIYKKIAGSDKFKLVRKVKSADFTKWAYASTSPLPKRIGAKLIFEQEYYLKSNADYRLRFDS